MNRIVVLGAGVMGSALCVPAADSATNEVILVGSPLDDSIINALKQKKEHPTLKVSLPDSIRLLTVGELESSVLTSADIIVFGVSSPGIEWACNILKQSAATPKLLALVTKGLVAPMTAGDVPLTYADALEPSMTKPAGCIVGIGGPCIARELALRFPTRVTFASSDIENARQLRSTFQTEYYRITTHHNIVGVEACAALKNFLCIGVSAMLTANALGESYAKNPLAALFNQAVLELHILSQWISHGSNYPQPEDTVAFDLAGMGDLHVTVGGGRNSRLGAYLGQGRDLDDLMLNELKGVTVEGVDTGRRLFEGFRTACNSGVLDINRLPLSDAILKSIIHNTPFKFDFENLPD